MKTLTATMMLMLLALTCSATMTEEWRLQQLIPKPDPARGKASNIQQPTSNAQQPMLAATDGPVANGFQIAPFVYLPPYPQLWRLTWDQPGTAWGWQVQISSNLVTWDIVTNVLDLDKHTNFTASATVRVKYNPGHFRIKRL